MSVRDCEEPVCTGNDNDAIAQVIEPKLKDLGGFNVRRVLPAKSQRRVGPFIFFDHMGPSTFPEGEGINVRPHPHIGLCTLTYLFDGEIMHRDSLGYVQAIQPGAVNWMTAGRGIVHSERTSDEMRAREYLLHGLQIWIALPDGKEEIEPDFEHYPAGSLPVISQPGLAMTLIAGEAFGEKAPVNVHSRLFYLHIDADAGAQIELPADHEECAVYVVDGQIAADGCTFDAGHMIVFAEGASPAIEATAASRIVAIGGEPLASDRTVFWNFSSSSDARIEQAKADWQSGRFDLIPGDDDEFIPLPE